MSLVSVMVASLPGGEEEGRGGVGPSREAQGERGPPPYDFMMATRKTPTAARAPRTAATRTRNVW
jgi:hypothetical protein